MYGFLNKIESRKNKLKEIEKKTPHATPVSNTSQSLRDEHIHEH